MIVKFTSVRYNNIAVLGWMWGRKSKRHRHSERRHQETKGLWSDIIIVNSDPCWHSSLCMYIITKMTSSNEILFSLRNIYVKQRARKHPVWSWQCQWMESQFRIPKPKSVNEQNLSSSFCLLSWDLWAFLIKICLSIVVSLYTFSTSPCRTTRPILSKFGKNILNR